MTFFVACRIFQHLKKTAGIFCQLLDIPLCQSDYDLNKVIFYPNFVTNS